MPLRTISALFQRDKVVYYYSAAVILAAKCLHGKNNVPSVASITLGGCVSPPSLGNNLRGCSLDARVCVCVWVSGWTAAGLFAPIQSWIAINEVEYERRSTSHGKDMCS